MKTAFYVCLALTLCKYTQASAGDASPVYQKCLKNCAFTECLAGEFPPDYHQPLSLKLTKWSCEDECKYQCMWHTVEEFRKRNLRTPQFHGKWPFIRVLGVQEPASAAFSFLNFLVHFKMLMRLRREIPKETPFFWSWHVFSAVCMNAWFWSTVFHTRDFPVTEFMDYACAFSILLVNCYFMLMRVLWWTPRFVRGLITVMFGAFYYNYVLHLSSGRIDYGYNMEVNILIGTHTAIGWFGWCVWNRYRQPYVWKCAIYVALTGVVLLLEVMDIPPIFWTFDCHSLWHLSTAPLAYLFYCFVIDDCNYLRKQKFPKQVLFKQD